MRAYVRYVIETLTAMEQDEPGSLPRARDMLLTAWLPLNQYAPEFRDRFMQLETLSRTPGKDASLPTSNAQFEQEAFRKQAEALNSPKPNDQSIDSMILREDFESARKLIDKLAEGQAKNQFKEKVNTKESLSLARQGDLLAAQGIAERLTLSGSILQVYPSIIEGYANRKDQVGASAAVRQAMRQLQAISIRPAPAVAQFGMPAEFAPTATERDGILATLSKLANAVMLIDSLLAAEIVDEIVTRANASQIDTSQGRTGIDTGLFKNFAAQDQVRAHAAAESFRDRLRRIVALAAVYQWKANELEKGAEKKAA